MKPEDLREIIKSTAKNKVFTVTFSKKDNSKRVMNCRLKVKKFLKGGEQPYNPKDYDLLTVYDMQKKDYRNINLNTITNIKIGGLEIKVNKNKSKK